MRHYGQKFYFILILSSLSFSSLLANYRGLAYVPQDWYQHPEDRDFLRDQSFSFHQDSSQKTKAESSKKQMGALSQALQNILNANAKALAQVSTKSDKKWDLSYVRTSLAIGAKGLLGLLSLKGMSAVKLYWRPTMQASAKKEKEPTFDKKEAVDDEVILKNHFTQKELLETIEPAIKRALSTGRIKNTSKFKKELTKAVEDFHFIISGMNSFEQHSRWWVRRLLLELHVAASGQVSPFATFGTELRIRFRWQRICLKGPEMTLDRNEPLLHRSKNKLSEFVYNMANDLDTISAQTLKDSGYTAKYFRIGLGLGLNGNIFLAKSKAQALFYVFFARSTKANLTQKKLPFDKNAHIWVLSEQREKDLHYARLKGITFQEGVLLKDADINPAIENVIYKVERKTFRQGLEKTHKIAKFFANGAKNSASTSWELFHIETQFEISLTGFFGLASLSGLAATRIQFYTSPV